MNKRKNPAQEKNELVLTSKKDGVIEKKMNGFLNAPYQMFRHVQHTR